MAKLNPYVLRPVQSIGTGVTTIEHIATIGHKAPTKLSDIATLMYSANRHPLMSTILNNKAVTKEFADDSEYTWDLVGSYKRYTTLVEARDENGNVISNSASGVVGKSGVPFYLVFSEQYFAEGESITGKKGSYYMFKIMEEPISEGSNVVYKVCLTNGADTGVEKKDLGSGEKFTFFGSSVSNQLSRKAGGIRKHTMTSMRNEWTTIRKYNKYIGRADKQLALATAIPLERIKADGKVERKVVNSWFDNETWIYMQEWEEEKERWLMFGRSNRNTNGSYFGWDKSGLVDRHGNGLLAQAQYSGCETYNKFSLKQFADAIYAKFSQGKVPFDKRHIVAVTGEWGLIQVNEEIRRISGGFASGYTVNADNLGIVDKVNNATPGLNHTLGYGAQFTQYRGANGLVIDFVLDPALDDDSYNMELDESGNGLKSSRCYFVFDMGTEAEPNIFKCKVQGEDDYHKFRIGMRNPFGIKNNDIISYDEDSAEIHSMTTFGALIKDPERVLIYMPSGLWI